MLAKNKAVLFLLAGVILGAAALSYPDPDVRMYGVAGLLGIVMVLAISIPRHQDMITPQNMVVFPAKLSILTIMYSGQK